ncbi:hypothetical protein [Bacillus sp. AFS040349]|uniref:hypothetical protein n=1 Tax=Bacillus sp. AFS040349 TaxID=2033502 RepID=UPI000BFCD239|nr:hypothetical protein [Bacillus sp. AFS040349]PGT83280.1 hypothetical protein COD11_13170 [Bacillus sp. AFS040349]
MKMINSGYETAVNSVTLQANDLLSVDYISNHTVSQMNGIHYLCQLIIEEVQNEKYHSYREIYDGLQSLMVGLYNSNNIEDNNPEFVQSVKKNCDMFLQTLQASVTKEVII